MTTTKHITKHITKNITKHTPMHTKLLSTRLHAITLPSTPSLNTERYEQHLADRAAPQVLICTGPAGTGKTMLACKHAVKHIIDKSFDKLIITRPNVSVEEELGYLPGSMEQKMSPWMIPLLEYLEHFSNRKTVQRYIDDGVIDILPLGYMRGRTFDNTLVVADEMQNCTDNQMLNLLTRIGHDSKLVLTGDLSQCDLRSGHQNGLESFVDKYDTYQLKEHNDLSDAIAHIHMDIEDVKRSAIVRTILAIYDVV